jgi:hypothetical protein
MTMPSIKALSAAALLACLASPAFAADVTISDGWFRALPAGLPAGGYMMLHNAGTADAVLTGASSPACGMVMLHKSSDTGGMSRMERVKSVTVPAGGSVVFKPGGYHLMCMHPSTALTPGATVPVTLIFADVSRAHADFAVKNAKGE